MNCAGTDSLCLLFVLYKENHSLGEWFKRRRMPMMWKKEHLLL
ncbi:hypothetical protein CLOSTMETH_01875 [[Clostridium] methylpentosum DSM 5476]|uniref:Uncharacterized protein n=1 Tax=[Clostridium] methylpentosum DSM 5476 TaxID=537013 RepID=C0EDE8_9FIRM|nr:hypothetical protein CLOSTMETH_01875 [[Clostridium] methylpentosum DSM 5476]